MEQSLLKEFTNIFSMTHLLKAAGVLFIAWATVRFLKVLLERLAKRFNRYRLQISRLYPILRLTVWTLAIGFILFGLVRPPENVVLAVLASSGIAVGLAAQDLIRNVFAGIMMLFVPPYRIGDMVRMGNHYGEVISLNLNVTHLRTFDDNVVVIPNAEVFKQPVSNANTGELTEMVVVDFVLPATVDVQQVKQVGWDAAVCSPYTYLKKPISVIVEDHFDYTFLTRFKIKAYVLDIRFERIHASDMIERVKKSLAAQGLLTEQMLKSIAIGSRS